MLIPRRNFVEMLLSVAEAWQDCRTVISFLMGALVCNCTRSSRGEREERSKGGLHVSLFW